MLSCHEMLLNLTPLKFNEPRHLEYANQIKHTDNNWYVQQSADAPLSLNVIRLTRECVTTLVMSHAVPGKPAVFAVNICPACRSKCGSRARGGNKIINFHTERGIVIGKTAFFFPFRGQHTRPVLSDWHFTSGNFPHVRKKKKERWQSAATYLTGSRLFKVEIIAYKSRANDCHESELGVCTHWFTAWS